MKDLSPANALLLRCVDGLLAAALFGVPLLMGGRQALGHLAIVLIAIAAAAAWCLHQALSRQGGWSWSGAEILLAAAVLLVGAQLLPLRPALIQTLSPRLYEILPQWSPATAPTDRFGVWSCLSLTPADTRNSLILLIAFAILFLVAAQRMRELGDVERILRWIAVAGTLMAAFGLVQYLAGNGKFFWFYEHPFSTASRDVKGSFTNRNHFAHFVVLAIAPLVWWIHTTWFRHSAARSHEAGFPPRRNTNAEFLLAALGLSAFAVLMSLSRGGIAVLFLSTVLGVLLLYRGSLLDRKTVLFFAATAALVIAGLGVYGYHLVANRIDDFQSFEQLDALQQRTNLWRADLAAAADFHWLGTGVGSHVEVNPLYLPDDDISQNLRYTHAENGYLQVLMETGIAGLLLTLAAIALLTWWCLPVLYRGISRRTLLCYVGIVPSLAANLAHSFVDFVWYVPGCMVVVVLLAACAFRLAQISRPHPARAFNVPVPRIAWLLALPAILALGCLTFPRLYGAVQAEPHWHRTLAQWPQVASDGTDDQAKLQAIAQDLSRVVQYQPDHALAHARLAEVHLRLFYQAQGPGAMGARDARDAAISSQFTCWADLHAWLVKAFPEAQQHLGLALQHALQAVALCPVHGSTYLHLARLTFLQGPNAPGKACCIHQAVLLRPYDGAVLFEAGQEAALDNHPDAAYAFYRRSFQCGSRHQDRLIRLLADKLPATAFLQIFPMDLRAASSLEAQYRRQNRDEDLKIVLQFRAATAAHEAAGLRGAEAVDTWLSAARAYHELGQPDACLSCLQQALPWGYSDYNVRSLLAKRLFEANRFAEAQKHLAWCQQRKPNDASIRAMLDQLASQRLRTASAAHPEQPLTTTSR